MNQENHPHFPEPPNLTRLPPNLTRLPPPNVLTPTRGASGSKRKQSSDPSQLQQPSDRSQVLQRHFQGAPPTEGFDGAPSRFRTGAPVEQNSNYGGSNGHFFPPNYNGWNPYYLWYYNHYLPYCSSYSNPSTPSRTATNSVVTPPPRAAATTPGTGATTTTATTVEEEEGEKDPIDNTPRRRILEPLPNRPLSFHHLKHQKGQKPVVSIVKHLGQCRVDLTLFD